MRKIYIVTLFCLIAGFSFSQGTLPQPFSLSTGNYSLIAWDSLTASGTYPPSMVFHYTIQPESSSTHIYDSSADGARNYDCPYNLTSRNRILGLGSNGFAFLSTGSAQYNDCSGTSSTADTNRYVGAAVLALNTTGKSSINIAWKSTVITLGDGNKDTTQRRQYAVRLQYRVGSTGAYTDVISNGLPVECNSIGKVAGQVQNVSAALPAACNNQSAVYLRWVYFSIVKGSGTRPEISVDDIEVGTGLLPVHLLSFSANSSNGAAFLSWTTANETDFSHFELEKSANGVTYSVLASVAARGTSGNNTYNITDTKPAAGSNFYRLKMVNTDGTSSYSSVVAFTGNAVGKLSVYPNPVINKALVTHPVAGIHAHVIVYSFDGKKIAEYTAKTGDTQTTLFTGNLAKGNYLVIYNDGAQKLTTSITK